MASISRASSGSNEESGWTSYLEDFFNNYNNNDKCSVISSDDFECNSSLVSDAASLAAKTVTLKKDSAGDEVSADKKCNRSLSLNKRKKNKAALVDDALEDTASSPLRSPEVFCANQLDKSKHKEEIHPSQEKGSTSGQADKRSELGFHGRDSDCTKLEKKGLCLVPLSMVLR